MTPAQREEAVKLLAAYDAAMASQPKAPMANVTLIVMANYGDLCASLLRAILKAEQQPATNPEQALSSLWDLQRK